MSQGDSAMPRLRRYIGEPIPQIFEAAQLLNESVDAHLRNERERAATLIRQADMRVLLAWLSPIWEKSAVHLRVPKDQIRPPLAKDQRSKQRMPSSEQKKLVHLRDGYSCRFCGIPVIRPEIRKKMKSVYPDALPWGKTDHDKHAAFMVLWAQYDHIVPHAHGGTNDLNNLFLACAACNFGRAGYTLEDVGVEDPRSRPPIQSSWDGLERFK